MNRCLLFPETMERSALAPLCVRRRSVVFLGLKDEDVPRFIVDAAAELKGKGIVDKAAPCALFTRSFLTGSGESGQDRAGGLVQGRQEVGNRVVTGAGFAHR